ncbi:MAG TPA: hypothetical protein DFS52_09840 [Myxococcales bacterium]|nr:hypothetical protein [Myxococcales bacterium]
MLGGFPKEEAALGSSFVERESPGLAGEEAARALERRALEQWSGNLCAAYLARRRPPPWRRPACAPEEEGLPRG